jgi:glycosyltransferase involved in cell wall biosynthesis
MTRAVRTNRSNLHLFVTTATNESRLFKEAANSLETGRFAAVSVAAFWEEGLSRHEVHNSGLVIERLATVLRRLQARGFLKKSKVLRPLLMAFAFFEYAIIALRLAWKMRPSHVSVHNPVLLPVGRLVELLTGARIVYLPHELEAERTGLTGTLKRLFVGLERRFIRHCKAVVVVCEPIARWYSENYGLSNVEVVRNVPRAADVSFSRQAHGGFRTDFDIPQSALVFIYQGLIEEERGCGALVSAMKDSTDHIVFMGYGDFVTALKQLSAQNIHYQPAVPLQDIISYTAGADIGVFVVEGQLALSYAVSLPNKFFEYVHAGLPVVVSDNLTYLSSLVREYQLGWVVPADVLGTSLVPLDRSRLTQFRKNVQSYARDCIWERDAVAFDRIYADE